MSTITARKYHNEDDYWRIRTFLRELMLLNDLRELSWHVARLDYWRWHVLDHPNDISAQIFLWETATSEIVAVLNTEGPGNAYFQLHPNYPHLESTLLDTAEQYLRNADGRLIVWSDSENTGRNELLQNRGYTRGDWPEHQWRRDLNTPIPEVSAPPGYIIRALGGPEENPARSWCSWRAFHPDEPDSDYEGYAWYAQNIQLHQPLYRRDLDIIAVPDSEPFAVAAFVTVWYDDVTRTAYFEPVGTAPEHQRRGLSRAILTEGLRRVQRLGCKRAFVGGYSEAANGLYRAVFSEAHDLSVPWIHTTP